MLNYNTLFAAPITQKEYSMHTILILILSTLGITFSLDLTVITYLMGDWGIDASVSPYPTFPTNVPMLSMVLDNGQTMRCSGYKTWSSTIVTVAPRCTSMRDLFIRSCASCRFSVTVGRGNDYSKNIVCEICVGTSYQGAEEDHLNRLVFRRYLIQKRRASDAKLVAPFLDTFGSWVKDFIKSDRENTVDRLSRLILISITRQTIKLETEVSWPAWANMVRDFKLIALDCESTAEDLQKGCLPVAKYKQVRETWLRVADIRLPQSPKVMGILKALNAPAEVIKAFETRGCKDRDISIYLSNDMEPLMHIGVWGRKWYTSCQDWEMEDPSLSHQVLGHLEDPNVMVMWAGGPKEMRTRVLVRKLVDAETGVSLLALDRWYGDAGYVPEMIEALKAYAHDNNFTVVQITDRDGGRCATTINWVEFSSGSSYSDFNGWKYMGSSLYQYNSYYKNV